MISTQTKTVVKSIPIGDGPTGVAVSPTGKLAYVAVYAENKVKTINTETMAVTGPSIEVGEGPIAIEFTPGGTAYVVDQSGKEVSAINTATRSVADIQLSPKSGEPRGIAISPDGTDAYVVGRETGPISVIDTGTNRVAGEIAVAGEPQEVAFAASGKTAYVTEGEPQQVQAINVETGKVVGSPITLPGLSAAGIALTPDQSPVAVFTPPSATVGIAAPFDGSASTDADGTIASYNWTFEDGATRPVSAPSTPSSPPAPSTPSSLWSTTKAVAKRWCSPGARRTAAAACRRCRIRSPSRRRRSPKRRPRSARATSASAVSAITARTARRSCG